MTEQPINQPTGNDGAGEAPTEHYDLWIIHKAKRLLLTDLGGVPVEVTGYVSEEAQKAAEERGAPTISEIGFDSACHMAFTDWEEARRIANEKAMELDYQLDVELYQYDDDFLPDEEDYDDSYLWDDGGDYDPHSEPPGSWFADEDDYEPDDWEDEGDDGEEAAESGQDDLF